MVDFSKYLDAKAGEAKRPPVLPEGTYDGVIKGHQIGDANKNKTPYVRFALGLTAFPEGVDGDGIDLSKRSPRRDYYLTDDALFRLDEFMRSCGVEISGRTYREALPEMIGQSVKVEIQHYVNQNSGELGDQVGKVYGEHE